MRRHRTLSVSIQKKWCSDSIELFGDLG